MIDIYVINLQERSDRLEHVKETFPTYNIIPVEAVKHSEGYKGCFLSHKKCVQIAKDKELKYIIVIEDDCLPLQNFTTRLQNILTFLESYNNWDLLIGGGFRIELFNIEGKIDTPIENLYKINGGYCMHFVIYNHTSYDFFLNRDIDRPIDHTWQNNLRCIVPVPFIANQLDNFSNISNRLESAFPKRIRLNNKRLISYTSINNVKIIK